jgi:hypothetical protein
MRLLAIFASLALLASVSPYATAEEAPAGANAQQQVLSEGELDALVAPIALYPDALLAQVLMASTYPLEVVQAERWKKANKSLKGDKLKEALDKQDWDASIKALVATPTVLSMMNGDLDWLEKLGDAVLAQQPDVMDAIQRLRSKAQANGKLTTTKQQKVSVTQQADKQVIVIEPTSPESVYVPYYEPSVVYGTWPYEDYEPYYFPPAPGYIVGGALATGIAWGAAYAIGNAVWDNFDWGHGNINVDVDKNFNFDRHVDRNNVRVEHWQHNAQHRHGVGYNNKQVQNKFANANAGNRKLDYRGRNGQEVLKPGAKPGNNLGGQGPLHGNKPNVGKGPSGAHGNRPTQHAGLERKPNVGKGPQHHGGGKPKAGHQVSHRAGAPKKGGGHARPSGGGNRVAHASHRPSGGHRAGGGNRGGGGHRAGGGHRGGGGGHRGGGRGGGGRGGGRRSDIRFKEDIVPLAQLNNGIELYRFRYKGSDHTTYVGVMAQEVQKIEPSAVWRDRSGYLMVDYDRIGVSFMTWKEWLARTHSAH